jgi:NitT/TauT family transport system substrate-binding protein
MNQLRVLLLLLLVLPLLLAGCKREPADAGAAAGRGGERLILRVGHFPNITHAQALIARALAREGKGWFEERLGAEVEVQWFAYNAGPSAMEAFFAGALDLTYVGPNPALNAYMKSRGEEVRIVAGAATGGAALVVQGDGRIKGPADFRGKKVATPQLGNTQDVSCRAWLTANGFKVTQLGGDVAIAPTENPDQLGLFREKAIDAAWTVEPWVSRLELEAGGTVLLEEKDAVTTVLAARARFLSEHRELVRRFVAAHAELTEWIKNNADEARRLVAEELKAQTTRAMPPEVLSRSWGRLTLTSDISVEPLQKFVAAAQSAGFLRDAVDLSRLVEKLP